MPGQQDGIGLGPLRVTVPAMRTLTLLLVVVAAPAPAAERKLFVSSFDRLRVEGPFQVVVTVGRSPAGRVAGDPRRLDGVEVRQEGGSVVVRAIDRRDDSARGAAKGPATGPVVVTLATPALAAVAVVGAGAVTVAGLKAARADLSVAGPGTIAVTGADAADLNATTVGTGRINVSGRAMRARLVVNGAGAIQADALDARALTVRLDGPGEVAARARYTADVTNTGLGRVVVAGSAKCVVNAVTGGSVVCGK